MADEQTNAAPGRAGNNGKSPPQSVALVWTVLLHVLVLPLAGAFSPMLMLGESGAAHTGISLSAASVTLVLCAAIVVLHGLCWLSARRAGEGRLQAACIGLAALSLGSLFLMSTPSPLVAAVRLVALVL